MRPKRMTRTEAYNHLQRSGRWSVAFACTIPMSKAACRGDTFVLRRLLGGDDDPLDVLAVRVLLSHGGGMLGGRVLYVLCRARDVVW